MHDPALQLQPLPRQLKGVPESVLRTLRSGARAVTCPLCRRTCHRRRRQAEEEARARNGLCGHLQEEEEEAHNSPYVQPLEA